jgi:hypothetical protein
VPGVRSASASGQPLGVRGPGRPTYRDVSKKGRLAVTTLSAELADQLSQTVVGVTKGLGDVGLRLTVAEYGPQGLILGLLGMLGLGEEGSTTGIVHNRVSVKCELVYCSRVRKSYGEKGASPTVC